MRNLAGCLYPGSHSLQLVGAIEKEQAVAPAAAVLVPAELFAMGWCRCKKFISAQKETGQIIRRDPVWVIKKLIITGSRNILGWK